MSGRRPCGPLSLLDRRVGSLGCARCGECCEQIVLTFDPREMSNDRHPENEDLYRDYWVVEWVDDNHRYPRGQEARGPAYVVTCKAYDAEHRACTHPDRPPICRDYPHYSEYPRTGEKLDRVPLSDGVTSCSYMLDIPGWSQHSRPLIPVTVLQTRPADEVADDGEYEHDDGDEPQDVHGESEPAEQREQHEQGDQSEHGDLLVAAW